MEATVEKNQQHQVACFSCRASRQKCDRQDPCKPDSVEKLLSRIEESGAKDEIIAALLGTGLPSPNKTVSVRGTPWTQAQSSSDSRATSQPAQPNSPPEDDGYDHPEDLISPLSIVTTAIATNTSIQCERLRSQMPMQPGVREAIMAPIKERLGAYFCLLDATLHTVDYVYANSFTLFSVICALGCAMSARPRDRAIYPVLVHLASGNVKWSIAAAVKSLATIQAIVNMQYWTPVSPTQVDDTSSISLNYAMQLAREMGISKSDVIREYVNAECESSSPENKGRYIRNYERTWLRTLISDKGFGIMNGKLHSVNWKEIPSSASQWWKAPLAEPTDRMLSGIIESRRLLLSQVDKRKQANSTMSSIVEWHNESYDALTRLRNDRCIQDDSPSGKLLPVLAFYMDHSILVLNAQALRDITAADDKFSPSSSEILLNIERKSIEVASRVLDLLASDKTIIELALGFQNNQYLMICHVMTEVLRAIKRGALTPEENSAAAGKVVGVIPLLDQIVQLLPATSAAHLYFDLARFFACQIDSLMGAPDLQEMRETIDTGMFTDDWFKAMDTGMPDVYTLLDMGYLGMDQPMMDTNDFMVLNDLNSIT
ncbi:hypothetical protein ACHAP8_005520 [Fusarium lateritium]